jgi:hypothetical protein
VVRDEPVPRNQFGSHPWFSAQSDDRATYLRVEVVTIRPSTGAAPPKHLHETQDTATMYTAWVNSGLCGGFAPHETRSELLQGANHDRDSTF